MNLMDVYEVMSQDILYCDTDELETIKKYAEHEEKYRWHDLHECPDDLPVYDGYEVPLMFITESGFYNIGFYGEKGIYRDKYFRHSRDAYEGFAVNAVRAWRYIEPFMEGTE